MSAAVLSLARAAVKPKLTHGQRKHLRTLALLGEDPFREAFDDDALANENAASAEAEAYFRQRSQRLRAW